MADKDKQSNDNRGGAEVTAPEPKVVNITSTVDVKNRFAVGDRLEVIHPSGNQVVTLSHIRAQDGSELAVAPGSGHIVRIPLDARFDRALLARFL